MSKPPVVVVTIVIDIEKPAGLKVRPAGFAGTHQLWGDRNIFIRISTHGSAGSA